MPLNAFLQWWYFQLCFHIFDKLQILLLTSFSAMCNEQTIRAFFLYVHNFFGKTRYELTVN